MSINDSTPKKQLSPTATIAVTSKSDYPRCLPIPLSTKKMPHQSSSTTLFLKCDYHQPQTIALTSKSNYPQCLPIPLSPKKVPHRYPMIFLPSIKVFHRFPLIPLPSKEVPHQSPSMTLFLKSDYHRPKTIALTSKSNYPRCPRHFYSLKKYSHDSNQYLTPQQKTLNTKHQITKNNRIPASDARQVSGRLGMSVSD